MSASGRCVEYTVRQAAWLLGVPRSTVSGAIRRGRLRVVWRRGRLVVPAPVVVRLLGGGR
ncbi:helix-turn-helix domain-containing protein [Actinosynnema pretiosum]|uniref:Helix-turn-helix domain-containing protein n=1 Tax=Actinosynnema pretiosum TaxID=42197 RepID=A0A290Z9S3_9PSEU|nr:helix-turn-helix domain-containing protein [Actinosynnema pretiosum]ATE55735.1 helix-turn-helix domain-containing protein [Actinosynnema pretiosum]